MMSKTLTKPTRMRFTVEEYYRLAEMGVIPPDARVELIEGDIIQMTPIGPSHGDAVDRLNEFFLPNVKRRARIRVQGPLRVNDRSQPEPDLMLLKFREKGYRQAHPSPADVLLLIEVADSTLHHDLHAKLRLYARVNIVEYWVVDIPRRILIVHRQPEGESYQIVSEKTIEETVEPLAFPDIHLKVGAIFGLRP